MQITFTVLPVSLADGVVITLRAPSYKLGDLGYGPLHPDTMLSPV